MGIYVATDPAGSLVIQINCDNDNRNTTSQGILLLPVRPLLLPVITADLIINIYVDSHNTT